MYTSEQLADISEQLADISEQLADISEQLADTLELVSNNHSSSLIWPSDILARTDRQTAE